MSSHHFDDNAREPQQMDAFAPPPADPLRDLGQSIAELASLQFLGWTALAAAAFSLVVMKRARGGS